MLLLLRPDISVSPYLPESDLWRLLLAYSFIAWTHEDWPFTSLCLKQFVPKWNYYIFLITVRMWKPILQWRLFAKSCGRGGKRRVSRYSPVSRDIRVLHRASHLWTSQWSTVTQKKKKKAAICLSRRTPFCGVAQIVQARGNFPPFISKSLWCVTACNLRVLRLSQRYSWDPYLFWDTAPRHWVPGVWHFEIAWLSHLQGLTPESETRCQPPRRKSPHPHPRSP